MNVANLYITYLFFLNTEKSCESLSVIDAYYIGVSKYDAVCKALNKTLYNKVSYMALLTVAVTGSPICVFSYVFLNSYLIHNQPVTPFLLKSLLNGDPRLKYLD